MVQKKLVTSCFGGTEMVFGSMEMVLWVGKWFLGVRKWFWGYGNGLVVRKWFSNDYKSQPPNAILRKETKILIFQPPDATIH